MVFSSLTFLYLFLPAVLLGYFVIPRRCRNFWLLFASLFFYAWGETFYVFLMLVSLCTNYAFGLLLDKSASAKSRKAVLGAAVSANLGLLAAFKYANFFADNANILLDYLGLARVDLAPVHLPIGISFFTFQAMSYLIDVYRGDGQVQRNPINVALYISLFPQLIAGPIVRYHDIAAQLLERKVTLDRFGYGVRRFIVGLGKKVLIANSLALTADVVFDTPVNELTTGLAWLGVVCYTLQIYFDFSGYSDMAIGLGWMFGFRLLENFNYPYVSKSLREFWRRWHISLSSWFRDYLYIPLGGNRYSPLRTHFNLILVFFLCGLWHGASWTFVVWGLYHGVFLVLERTRFGELQSRLWAPVQHIYALLVAMVGWVFFRAETFQGALGVLRAMIGFDTAGEAARNVWTYLDAPVVLAILVGVIGSTPIMRACSNWVDANKHRTIGGVAFVAGSAACLSIFVLSAAVLASQTHNPFIYFRF